MANNSNIWELPGQSFRSGMNSGGVNNPNFIRTQHSGNGSVLNTPLGRVQVAPPVPPRPVYNNYNNSFMPQGSYFNNYGFGGYSGYGGSTLGYGYRPGLNCYGYGFGPGSYYGANNPESRFIQLAEESSRPAFQTIQSVLQAFSSVAMMFDSTFNALYSSYMSVIGVADNFGKLRSTFGQIFSAFAIFRTLHWLFRRLMYLIGISKTNPEIESLWAEALIKSEANAGQKHTNQKNWSMMLLLSIIMAGPYFLFKLMSHIYPSPTREVWNPVENPGSLAVAVYDFHASNDRELSFSNGQKLMIAPQNFQPLDSPGWLLACNENRKVGLIPNNYIGMIMKSEKTGKTYVDHNGQKYQAESNVEADVEKYENGMEGLSKKLTKMNVESEDKAEAAQ